MSKKNQPIYRAKFCAVTGTSENGNDILGKSVEIGAVWERKDPSKGAVLKLDIVPEGLSRGVLFLQPVKAEARGFA